MPSAGGSWPRPSALEPCFVALGCVGARLVAGGQTVVNVTPVIRRYVSRIDVQRLHGVDRLEHALDLRPTVGAKQYLPARTHEGQRLMRLAGADRAHDVDPRNERAERVRRPADEREDCIGREATEATDRVAHLTLLGEIGTEGGREK